MSCFSDYKVGALSEDEFRSAARRECMDIDQYDRFTCRDCSCYEDCKKQILELGYPQCEQGENYFEDEFEEYEENNNGQN